MKMSAIVVGFLFAACGDGSRGAVDAPSSTVDAVTEVYPISGTAQDALSMATLAGVVLTSYRTSDDSVFATAITSPDGTYSLALPIDLSSKTALDGYIKATLDQYADTHVFVATHFLRHDWPPLTMLKPEAIADLYGAAGIPQDPAAATIMVKILNSVAGAVTVAPASDTGVVKYGLPPSMTATGTLADGIAWVLDAPIGNVIVGAEAEPGHAGSFDDRLVKGVAHALSLTIFDVIPRG
jgi:hypothetical protein